MPENEDDFGPLRKYANKVMTVLLTAAVGYLMTGQWTFESSYTEERNSRDVDVIRLINMNDIMKDKIAEMDKELALLKQQVAFMHEDPLPPSMPRTMERVPNFNDITVPKGELDDYQRTRSGN